MVDIETIVSYYSFIITLNSDPRFAMEIGNQSICFSDSRISIAGNKLITTAVYSKPTDSHLYLYEDSYHKKSLIKGIQKGVTYRLRPICSSDDNFTDKSKE